MKNPCVSFGYSYRHRRTRLGRGCVCRFLDALELDVPVCEIALQYADKSLFRVVTLLSTKDEIWMRHEIRYALEHAPGFEGEGREGNFVKIHADSGEFSSSSKMEVSSGSVSSGTLSPAEEGLRGLVW